jgi:hypothetical protein
MTERTDSSTCAPPCCIESASPERFLACPVVFRCPSHSCSARSLCDCDLKQVPSPPPSSSRSSCGFSSLRPSLTSHPSSSVLPHGLPCLALCCLTCLALPFFLTPSLTTFLASSALPRTYLAVSTQQEQQAIPPSRHLCACVLCSLSLCYQFHTCSPTRREHKLWLSDPLRRSVEAYVQPLNLTQDINLFLLHPLNSDLGVLELSFFDPTSRH